MSIYITPTKKAVISFKIFRLLLWLAKKVKVLYSCDKRKTKQQKGRGIICLLRNAERAEEYAKKMSMEHNAEQRI